MASSNEKLAASLTVLMGLGCLVTCFMQWVTLGNTELGPLIETGQYGTYLAIASVGLVGLGLVGFFSENGFARYLWIAHIGMIALVVYLFNLHSNWIDEFGWKDGESLDFAPAAYLALFVTVGGAVLALGSLAKVPKFESVKYERSSGAEDS